MYIKVKPDVYLSSFGFDYLGSPITKRDIDKAIHETKVRRKQGNNLIVYWCEKHRKKTRIMQKLKKDGTPSKSKPVIVETKAHWRYKIWVIDEVIVKLLRMQGKHIVQHKHHWSIEKIS